MLQTSQLTPAQNPLGLQDEPVGNLPGVKDILARNIAGIAESIRVYLLDRNQLPIFFPDPLNPGQTTCELTRTGAVSDVKLQHNVAQDVHHQLTLVLKEVPGLVFHALTDHVAVTYCFYQSDGTLLLEYPQGIFGFEIPDRKLDAGLNELTVTGFDPTFDLTLLKFEHNYLIPADAQVVAACVTIMEADINTPSEGGRQPSGTATGTCPSRNSPVTITVPQATTAASTYSAPTDPTTGQPMTYTNPTTAFPGGYFQATDGTLYNSIPAEYMGPGAPGSGILAIWSGTTGGSTFSTPAPAQTYILPPWPDTNRPGLVSGGCDQAGANIDPSRILADPSTATMGADNTLTDKENSHLSAINTMLTGIGFRKLYYDHTAGTPITGLPSVPNGAFRLQNDPYSLGQTPAPEWTLDTRTRQVMKQGVQVKITDQGAIVNKVILKSQNTTALPIQVVAENRNLDSATSITNWGKISTQVIQNDKVIDVTTAKIAAFAALNQGSRGTVTVDLECFLLPNLTAHSQLNLQVWDDQGIASYIDGSLYPFEVTAYEHDYSTHLTKVTATRSSGY